MVRRKWPHRPNHHCPGLGQGVPRVEGRSNGWQGLSRAVSGVAHHDGHTYQPLASLRLSAAVRKRKERNSLEAEARRIANVDFCLEVRVKKVRVNKFALITSSWIRGPKGGRGALARLSPPPSLAHSIHFFGQRAPSTMLESHLRTFVLLHSSRLLIVLYSPNGVRIQTASNGVQKPNGNNISDGLRRVQTEYKRVQTE